jgi:hypothetical protein
LFSDTNYQGHQKSGGVGKRRRQIAGAQPLPGKKKLF